MKLQSVILRSGADSRQCKSKSTRAYNPQQTALAAGQDTLDELNNAMRDAGFKEVQWETQDFKELGFKVW